MELVPIKTLAIERNQAFEDILNDAIAMNRIETEGNSDLYTTLEITETIVYVRVYDKKIVSEDNFREPALGTTHC